MKEIKCGLYPRHHYWGLDALQSSNKWEAIFLKTADFKIPRLVEKVLDKTMFKGSPGAKVELTALKASKTSDLIYSICGPLVGSKRYQRKLVPWVFRDPPKRNFGKLAHRAFSNSNLSANAAFLCLTPNAESTFSKFAKSKFIPWCVDLKLFDGQNANPDYVKPFFLATGKTYRDYKTLIEGSVKVNTEVRIIGPKNQKPDVIPENIKWIDTSNNPPDIAIDYKTLKEWYAKCIAVCIPLSGDADDTCGYTNMLEAMAMSKPVLMTSSGCLHINPETDAFGMQIKPRDVQGWAHAMHHLQEDHE